MYVASLIAVAHFHTSKVDVIADLEEKNRVSLRRTRYQTKHLRIQTRGGEFLISEVELLSSSPDLR